MSEKVAFDVLFVLKEVGNPSDAGEYLVHGAVAESEKAKEKALRGLKKSRYEIVNRDGKNVPVVREYKVHGQPGEFDHFVGRRVGDFILNYLELAFDIELIH